MRPSSSGVRRRAASAAASDSMAMRSSSASSTSSTTERFSSAMRNARTPSSSTKAPTPWRVVTRPLALRLAMASRTTVRLTPNSSMISFSVGSLSPRL